MSINLEKVARPSYWNKIAIRIKDFVTERIGEILGCLIVLGMVLMFALMLFENEIGDAFTDFDAWRLCNHVTNQCSILTRRDWNRIGELRFEDKHNPAMVKTFYHSTMDRIKLDNYK